MQRSFSRVRWAVWVGAWLPRCAGGAATPSFPFEIGQDNAPVLEIECIPKLVIIVSDCIPGFRSVCPMCIPTFKCVYHVCIATFSSFIVLRAQFPSPSFPCGSSPDTMKQLSLKPHLTAPSAKDDDSSSSSGSPAPFFMVCMYHMCIPECVSCVYPKNKKCVSRASVDTLYLQVCNALERMAGWQVSDGGSPTAGGCQFT